jgi:hypothetical protein
MPNVSDYLKRIFGPLFGLFKKRVVLKDGRDYRLEVTDLDVALVHRASGDTHRMRWKELTAIFVLALDKVPVGDVSFVLHRGHETLEIPWDTEGTKELLVKMQETLPGFDHSALFQSSTMTHGFKELWRRKRLSSKPFVIGREKRQ